MTEAKTTVFRAINGAPAENLGKVIEIGGGIGRFIGPDDVVLVKPNVQWWNQGAPNLAALSRFVELVFERPGGFRGEVVLAENCHRGATPWLSGASGWTRPFEWNSDLAGIRNMNELADRLRKRFGDRFTLKHWINVGSGGKRVLGPMDGEGYVFCDGTGGVPLLSCENGLEGDRRRATIMTYPIFRTDRGTVVDFRHGVWEKGAYSGRPFRFVNFAALNHHSTYCGLTSVVKNYMGITDLSGGPDPANGGKLTREYYNFHSFPFDKWAPGPRPGMLGEAIGAFLRTVRKADLNVVTAEWVGLVSRVTPPVTRTRAVLASADPVALDYHSAKYLLFPNSRFSFHDPDNPRSPLREYLEKCAVAGGGILDERHVEVQSFDLRARKFQNDDELAVSGAKTWGTDPKGILKYLFLRYTA